MWLLFSLLACDPRAPDDPAVACEAYQYRLAECTPALGEHRISALASDQTALSPKHQCLWFEAPRHAYTRQLIDAAPKLPEHPQSASEF